MKKLFKPTREQIEEIRLCYALGNSAEAIACEFGITVDRVLYLLEVSPKSVYRKQSNGK